MKNPPLRVFIVEDYPQILQGLRRYLEQCGHHVESATDLASARAQLRTAEVDLLISDIGLPDGDGWELMRQLEGNGQFRAVAMSGLGGAEEIAKSKAAGFQHHLVKPFLPNELQPILAEAQRLAASHEAKK